MLSELQPSDIKLLKTFLAVVDAGGLTAAQARAGRSLASISADIQSLETRLGQRVCQRGRGGFALSEYGRRLYESSRRLFEQHEQFVAEWQANPAHLSGPLRIAFNEGQISDRNFVLSEALSRFLRRPKNSVEVSVQMAPYERVQELLVRREIEVGFGFFQAMVGSIEMVPLFKERNQIYCGRTHPLFSISDRKITAEMIRSYPFVLRRNLAPRFYPRTLKGIGAKASGMTPESRAYLLLSGHYLGYLAEHHAETWVRQGLLRPLRPDLLSIDPLFQIAVRKTSRRPRHIQAFLDDYFTVARQRGISSLGELS